MKSLRFFLPLVLLFAFTSCEKKESDDPEPPVIKKPSFTLDFRFQVDGPALEFDTIKYENEAHNFYSVNTLVFYLSQITLIKEDSSAVQIKDWIYVDARDASTLKATFNDIPEGCYTAVRFNIGIDSVHNMPEGLPATANNLMMEWPVMMGGGYHFLKLEGYFADSSGTPGYAMHLGTNQCLTTVQLPVSLCFQEDDISRLLVANVNEWFRNPVTYDFNIDGNYNMGNAPAMLKIAVNGADVFSIQ